MTRRLALSSCPGFTGLVMHLLHLFYLSNCLYLASQGYSFPFFKSIVKISTLFNRY
ncbi:hypothetical protein EJ05DRAFT_479669 [Pseudovirgaria hyperparasitica]|uniref:Uncharacterized protein n=1 Tax=Pseudovirgaria hyperparasitica TaxID=470096 RepID=A0A6A6VWN4_9PEZI|nr:uncharacterized protein EJ05DRAFT_479669 [Pseudovirgaria hyperparasitica]KAF2754124.1 hypothetical protein EJ05DRAFT_479669 [Pseudovirgaria hyperparasitica]